MHEKLSTCWLCNISSSNSAEPSFEIYKNEHAFVFLDKAPVFNGHTLVAPRWHCEQVVEDFTLPEYIEIQSVIFGVAQAIQKELQPERIYILSLGSQTGNRHVHWHILPHPPGVPYDEQELIALRSSERDCGLVGDENLHNLAKRLKKRMQEQYSQLG